MLQHPIGQKGVTTNDVFQRRRPNHSLCPQWCVTCKRNLEVADHLFLHFPMACVLWQRLFSLCDDQWVAPWDCIQMLLIRFIGFRKTKRAKTMWTNIFFVIFWAIWLERNARIFDGKETSVKALWDRAEYLASFWAFVSPPFKGVPLFLISRAVVCHP
ncbi:hypothetical protein CsSME_00035842 [Camellia sinensis var. sinensis]